MPEFETRPQRSPQRHSPQKRRRRKKQNIFVSIISGLFPWKGDRPGDIARKLVFMVSLALLIYAAYAIIDFYVIRDIRLQSEIEAWQQIKESYEGEEMVTIYLDDDLTGGTGGEQTSVELIGEYVEYYEQNNDFIGHVEIFPYISYPVYQAADNEYYLNHDHNKIPTANGTIFADYEGIFTETERPHNTIIYGHNLITKYYFQPLAYYRQSMDFLVEKPTISFDTRYERGTYKIFAVFLTTTNPLHDSELFEYQNTIYFDNKSQFDGFVAECLDRSYYYTGVDLEYGDELLMLSTCDFSLFRDDMRLVICARRVRDGESPLVDTTAFIDNTGYDENGYLKRKMFEAFYELYGSAWGGRNWDTSYIKDFAG